jgi:hypothetical protein
MRMLAVTPVQPRPVRRVVRYAARIEDVTWKMKAPVNSVPSPARPPTAKAPTRSVVQQKDDERRPEPDVEPQGHHRSRMQASTVARAGRVFVTSLGVGRGKPAAAYGMLAG